MTVVSALAGDNVDSVTSFLLDVKVRRRTGRSCVMQWAWQRAHHDGRMLLHCACSLAPALQWPAAYHRRRGRTAGDGAAWSADLGRPRHRSYLHSFSSVLSSEDSSSLALFSSCLPPSATAPSPFRSSRVRAPRPGPPNNRASERACCTRCCWAGAAARCGPRSTTAHAVRRSAPPLLSPTPARGAPRWRARGRSSSSSNRPARRTRSWRTPTPRPKRSSSRAPLRRLGGATRSSSTTTRSSTRALSSTA